MKVIPDNATMGDRYIPTTEITDQAEADEHFQALVDRLVRMGYNRDEAEKLERENIGYFSGYFTPEIMDRVAKLFKCSHPMDSIFPRH